jgi:hypothetical protein
LVVDGEDGLCCVTVYELDSEDFSLRKGGADLNIELRLGWGGSNLLLDNFFNLQVVLISALVDASSSIDVIADDLTDVRETYLYGGGSLQCQEWQ